MTKKQSNNDLGLKVREAILKFGNVSGEGTVVCMPAKDSRSLLGTNSEIDKALSAIGIDDKLIKDITNVKGEKMTCIATTIEELTKE